MVLEHQGRPLLPGYRRGLVLIMAFFLAAGVVSAALLTWRTARPAAAAGQAPGDREPAGQVATGGGS